MNNVRRVISGVSQEFPPEICLPQPQVLLIISYSLILKTDKKIALHIGLLRILWKLASGSVFWLFPLMVHLWPGIGFTFWTSNLRKSSNFTRFNSDKDQKMSLTIKNSVQCQPYTSLYTKIWNPRTAIFSIATVQFFEQLQHLHVAHYAIKISKENEKTKG